MDRDLLGLVRSADHTTSVAAAEGLELRKLRKQVHDTFAEHPTARRGLHDAKLHEICCELYGHRPESSYRKRRTELTRLGLVAYTARKEFHAGTWRKVWAHTKHIHIGVQP